MNIARLNLSHESYDTHERRIKMVQKIKGTTQPAIAIMLDTKGPEIRN